MATLSGRDNEELQRLLQDAIIKCSERCLYQSAKWAAELLNSIPAPDLSSPTDTEVDSPHTDVDFDRFLPTGVVSKNDDPRESRLEAGETRKYLLAKTYFDCREYDRCASMFLPMTLPKTQLTSPSSSSNVNSKGKGPIHLPRTHPDAMLHLSQKALFLALYAKYMSGEKRKDEESEMILGPADGGPTINKELVGISTILQARLNSVEDGQGWLEYLYGIVLSKGKNQEQAKQWLVKSVHSYSFNWGAWQELGSLLGSTDDLQTILPHLPRNIMAFIFRIYQKQELFHCDEQDLSKLEDLRGLFPTSSFLSTQEALLYYHAKDFQRAEQIFSHIVSDDPLRLDDLDTYSNILYVMEKRAKLAFIAQLATATDRFRPETCCVVGNYYAMKSEHEKAVMYFRRALALDRNFLSAWTLMGHEYVELKNTQAAIECYRRAVDINRKDYRAWYGLGQTYEILEMHFYALFYFERAAALAPFDPKMWAAVGSCLAKMRRHTQAIKAFKRALVAGSHFDSGSSFGSTAQRSMTQTDMDPDVLWGIACMYHEMGDMDETKAYLELVLAQEDDAEEDEDNAAWPGEKMKGEGTRTHGVGVTATTSKARLWLAKIELARGGEQSLKRAGELANELCQDGVEVEEAKGIERQVRAQMYVDAQ